MASRLETVLDALDAEGRPGLRNSLALTWIRYESAQPSAGEGMGTGWNEARPTYPQNGAPQVKIKERYVFLVCTACSNRNYTTHKRLKATYKLEKKKWCKFCREHTVHKERKL